MFLADAESLSVCGCRECKIHVGGLASVELVSGQEDAKSEVSIAFCGGTYFNPATNESPM